MKVMERRIQTIERRGWAKYVEREREWIALEKRLGGFPPKRHYRPISDLGTTVIWERDWESWAALEEAYTRMGADPENRAIADKPPVTLEEHIELYAIPAV